MEHWMALLVAASVAIIVTVMLIYWLYVDSRDGILFRPIRTGIQKPTEPYIDKMLNQVHTRWFDRGHPTTLLFLHGNSGCLGNREYMIEFTRLIGTNLVLMDYRGYGESRGIPSISNMREDAVSVYDEMVKKYNPDDIVVMSESIGSASASHLVAHRKVRLLLMLCGLSSFTSIYKHHAEGASAVLSIAAKLSLPTIDKVANSTLLQKSLCPVLFIHSRGDRLVPYECAEENNDSLPHDKRLGILTIAGGHSTPVLQQEHIRRILEILQLPTDRATTIEMDRWRDYMISVASSIDFRVVDI